MQNVIAYAISVTLSLGVCAAPDMRKTNLEQLLARRLDGITVAPFERGEIAGRRGSAARAPLDAQDQPRSLAARQAGRPL